VRFTDIPAVRCVRAFLANRGPALLCANRADTGVAVFRARRPGQPAPHPRPGVARKDFRHDPTMQGFARNSFLVNQRWTVPARPARSRAATPRSSIESEAETEGKILEALPQRHLSRPTRMERSGGGRRDLSARVWSQLSVAREGDAPRPAEKRGRAPNSRATIYDRGLKRPQTGAGLMKENATSRRRQARRGHF